MISRDADAADVRFPPPLIYVISVGSGWGLYEFVQPLGVPFMPATWHGPIAIVVGSIGLLMLGYAAGLFLGSGQNPEPWKTTPSIVTTGVYRWTRNPMYVGMALLQLAIALYLNNAWIAVLTAPSLIGVYFAAVKPEEQYLAKKFGTDYRHYQNTVRRWL